jgi:8-oxo-dGTP pyrophosphatase MutT (NUDIX family)
MPHIHEKIDFTVSAYIVYEDKILLVHHKKMNTWIQIGGHVELDEDTDEAMVREIEEECGIEVEFLNGIVDVPLQKTRHLRKPHFLNIHEISRTHKHLDLGYVCLAKSIDCKLEKDAHNDIGWFTADQIKDMDIFENVSYFLLQALEIAANAR